MLGHKLGVSQGFAHCFAVKVNLSSMAALDFPAEVSSRLADGVTYVTNGVD